MNEETKKRLDLQDEFLKKFIFQLKKHVSIF